MSGLRISSWMSVLFPDNTVANRYRELLICEFKSLGTDLTTLSPAPGVSAASTASTAHTYFT